MNDLFRSIFGIPASDPPGDRMDDKFPKDNRHNFWKNSGDDDDNDDDDVGLRNNPRGIFGIPIFNDPVEIHKHLDKLVDDMNRAFGFFGFSSFPSVTWEEENDNNSFYNEEPKPKTENLRDLFFKKPDSCSCRNRHRDDFNFGLNIRSSDFEEGTSDDQNLAQPSYPKVYSKSVFIQTVRRPDGSVETIKKIRDHEGNEKTIISQSNINEPLLPPSPPSPPPPDDQLTPKDDTSGLSILKKFFSF